MYLFKGMTHNFVITAHFSNKKQCLLRIKWENVYEKLKCIINRSETVRIYESERLTNNRKHNFNIQYCLLDFKVKKKSRVKSA